MRKFLYIIIIFLAVLCTGCEKSTSTSTTSSVAQLSAFSFAKNDSMPGLAKAVFTVEDRVDTGLVWNKDSMLFGTSLEEVVPRFTFKATPGAAFLTLPDTTCVITGYDTLDFTNGPIYLTIRSSDRSTTKTYEIKPLVHQVDPYLYTWTRLNDGIYPADESEQRVLESGSDFVMLVSNGFSIRSYRSVDGISWSTPSEATGLPAGTRVRQIISDGSTLYYGQDKKIYTSTDAVTWTAHDAAYPVVTMLFHWNGRVWALAQNNGAYELAIWQADNLTLTGLQPQGEFPVSDFASVCFQSASGRERVMVIGGFAENGKSLNTRWNLEYSSRISENGGYRMEEFSIDRPQFTSLTGISVISYNGELQLFGGVDEKMKYFGRDILISTDEGLTWNPADTSSNQLPDVYQARQKQTAIVRDNNIYLFGGQDKTTTYSDVYKGRLNSIEW